MNQLAETLNVALSVPALVLTILVLWRWVPEASRAAAERRDAADWLVLGVAVSFLGIVLNMSWCAVYWAARVLHSSGTEAFCLDNGAVVNLLTRQAPVILAALCHLKAYHIFTREASRDPAIHLKWSMAVAALLALALIAFGGGPYG